MLCFSPKKAVTSCWFPAKPAATWFSRLGAREKSGGNPCTLVGCADRTLARYLLMQTIEYALKSVVGVLGGRRTLRFVSNALHLPSIFALEVLFASSLMAQTTASTARAPVVRPAAGSVHANLPSQYRANSSVGVTGLPAGPSQLPYPLTSTPANDAWVRNNAWAAYNESLHQIPTAANPNRLAAQQNLVDQDRFIQKPNSSQRYNFQFSDNEIRSVQAALRRMGTYSGQVDGILGPDTQRAIEEYQLRNKRPVTGQPDQWLNASLGIF